MKNIQPIDEFLKSAGFAIAGISRNEKKFGNYVYKELKKKNLKVFPVSSFMNSFDGDKCFNSITEVSNEVDALISIVNKDKTLSVIKEAHKAGINNFWLQQGTETEECLRYCKDNNLKPVYGECILMFTLGDKFPHNFHRFLWKTLGLYPK